MTRYFSYSQQLPYSCGEVVILESSTKSNSSFFVAQLVSFFNQSLVVLQMAQEGLLGEEIIGDDVAGLLDGLVGDMLRNNPGVQVVWQSMAHNWPHQDHVNALLEREDESEPNRLVMGRALPNTLRAGG